MPHLDSLIFDFDGVLADSNGAHLEARVESFERHGFIVDQAIHDEGHRHGSHPQEIIGWVLKQAGVIPADADVQQSTVVQSVVDLKNELYFEHAAHGLDAMSGVLKFVDWVHAIIGSQRLAIATTATVQREVKPFLERHSLTDTFGYIVGKEDTPAGQMKPNPYVFTQAISQLNIDPQQVGVIEDSPHGVQAAKAAGIFTFGITTTHSTADLAGADMVASQFADIQHYIKTT